MLIQLKENVKRKDFPHKKPHKLNHKERISLENIINGMVKSGILKASASPILNDTFMVPKKDDTYRMVVNLKLCNKLIKELYKPVPHCNQVLRFVQGIFWKYISEFDLRQSYFQILLNKLVFWIFSIITDFGQFEFTRAPMGAQGSAGYLQEILNQIFIYPFIIIYMDNI